MISYVAQAISLSVTASQNVFYIAWFIGKVIVSILTAVYSASANIIQNIMLFLQIAYEDNISIFTEEIPNTTHDLLQAAGDQWSNLQSGILVVYYDMNSKICAVISAVKWFVDAFIIMVSEVLLLFMNAVVFMGDTIWLIIIFIPVHLPQLMKVVFKSVTDVIVDGVVDAYMGLLKITNFLTDVPLESFAGLTSAVVIIRLYIHYKEPIQIHATEFYWSFVRTMWYCYYALYNYFLDCEVMEITRMSGGQVIERESSDAGAGVLDEGGDALCVICRERQKCVLTLPCRHVCLCTECCMRLYGYQRTCPICRTFIYHSVTVYL